MKSDSRILGGASLSCVCDRRGQSWSFAVSSGQSRSVVATRSSTSRVRAARLYTHQFEGSDAAADYVTKWER